MEFGLSNSQWSCDQTQGYFSSSYTLSLSKGSRLWSFPGLHRRGIYNVKQGTAVLFLPRAAIVYLNDLKTKPLYLLSFSICKALWDLQMKSVIYEWRIIMDIAYWSYLYTIICLCHTVYLYGPFTLHSNIFTLISSKNKENMTRKMTHMIL